MKKYISVALFALLALMVFSCKKETNVAGTEAKLPPIQLSSLGTQQTGPFTITPAASANILQLYFGATTTGIAATKFTVEILDGTTATSTVIKTVTFPAWSGKDNTSTATVTNHTISYILEPTTYQNTQVYGGNILLKLSLLGLTSGKTYSVRATAFGTDATNTEKSSVLTQTSFFKTL